MQTSIRDVSDLVEAVEVDLTDRRTWESHRNECRANWFLDTKKHKKPYPGAPDIPEPLLRRCRRLGLRQLAVRN